MNENGSRIIDKNKEITKRSLHKRNEEVKGNLISKSEVLVTKYQSFSSIYENHL
jgi:hypothetical protein